MDQLLAEEGGGQNSLWSANINPGERSLSSRTFLQAVYEAQTRNISARGVSFDTGFSVKPGDIVELQIDFPVEETAQRGKWCPLKKCCEMGRKATQTVLSSSIFLL